MADLIDRDALLKEAEIAPMYAVDAMVWYCLIKSAPAVNRWIPCSERLPEQEVRVLLFAADEVYVGELTDIKDLFDTDIGFMKIGHVTHWMPLPEPPEKE